MLKTRQLLKNLRKYSTSQISEQFGSKVAVSIDELQGCPHISLSDYPKFQQSVIIQPEKLQKEIEELMDMNLLRATTQKNQAKLLELSETIKSLEAIKLPIDGKIDAQIKRWKYYSLIYLTFQAAGLAHMTWIDFGWDIVEPISYAITFTVAIWSMAYYSMFRHDYTFTDAVKRIKMSKQYVKYQKANFDVDIYNKVVEEHQNLQKEIDRALKLLGEK